MARWKRILSRAAIAAAARVRELRYRAYLARGGPGPLKIQAYRGYGTGEKLHLKGRVLADKGETAARETDSTLRDLVNMYKRVVTRPIPRAELSVRFQDREVAVTADDLGYFETWIRPTAPLPDDRTWHDVALELRAPKRAGRDEVHATAQVLVPTSRTRFVVISDIDDTVVRTGATNVAMLMRESFLKNAHARIPFPGVAGFYRALRAGASGAEDNPLLYVSRSPWNLYDLLAHFFQLHEIPVGPVLFLRQWGLTEEGLTTASVEGLKFTLISRMLDLYRDLPFILIGDSGQKDPEIYTRICERFPGRVLAVYIRNVSRRLDRPEAVRALARRVAEQGSTLILADDSLVMARHALDNGWIAPESLRDVASAKAFDETPGPVERLTGQEKKAEGRTVEVERDRGPEGTKHAVDRGAIEAGLAAGDGSEGTPTVVVRGNGRPRTEAPDETEDVPATD